MVDVEDRDKVRLEFESGKTLDSLTSYQFDSDFLTPCDGFTVTIADDRVSALQDQLRPGEQVRLYVNNNLQFVGRIDSASYSISRSGTSVTLTGRDLLGAVCDSYISPEIRITEKDTLVGALKRIFSDFSFDKFDIDDEANRNIIAGQKAGFVAKGKTAKGKGKSLEKFINHQTHPNKAEGLYQYAERITKRFGLHIWSSADGETLYVGEPSYDQAPLYWLVHFRGDNQVNNVTSLDVKIDWSKQPSVIIGECKSGGGNFKKSTNKVIMVNEFSGLADGSPTPDVAALIEKYKSKGSKVLPVRQNLVDAVPSQYRILSPAYRPLFLVDDESNNMEELEFAVRRKMASLQHDFFKVELTTEGHSNPATGATYAINTVAHVEDAVTGLNASLWVKRRTFRKSRSEGTTTTLELVLPGSIEF
jgi:prophage tail gpP-like protein